MPTFEPHAAGITSVFGRTGAVVAATGDYTAAQVTNAADKSSGAGRQDFAATQGATFAGTIQGPGGANNVTIGSVGPGSTSGITFRNAEAGSNLYRTAAGVLTTDGTLVVGTGLRANPIASGPLPTVAPSSGAAFQCSTTRDVFLNVPVTYNPTAGAAATCLVELSPDGVTYSILGTESIPAGITFDGTVDSLRLQVPSAWFVRLTVTNAALGTGTYY